MSNKCLQCGCEWTPPPELCPRCHLHNRHSVEASSMETVQHKTETHPNDEAPVYPAPDPEMLKLYLASIYEEYKTIRDESKQASINMFTSLQWGGVTIGVVLAAVLSKGDNASIPLISFVFIPLLAGATLVLWLGEAIRLKRAGDYICFIEQKVSLLFDDFRNRSGITSYFNEWQETLTASFQLTPSDVDLSEPMAWEQWLKDMKDREKSKHNSTEGHQKYIYLYRLAFIVILPFVSLVAGLIYCWPSNSIMHTQPVLFYVELIIGGSVFIFSLCVTCGLSHLTVRFPAD